jgi:hypothetical protein
MDPELMDPYIVWKGDAEARSAGPQPGNADPQHCQWYSESGPRQKTVHLWGPSTQALASTGTHWYVRKCLVCDRLDTDYLMEQWRKA